MFVAANIALHKIRKHVLKLFPDISNISIGIFQTNLLYADFICGNAFQTYLIAKIKLKIGGNYMLLMQQLIPGGCITNSVIIGILHLTIH